MTTLPTWAREIEPVDIHGAAKVLGVSVRFLSDILKDHPYYETRGRGKKVFYPEHLNALRSIEWDSPSKPIRKQGSSRLAAPSGASELERARARATEQRQKRLRKPSSATTGKVVPMAGRKA